MALMLGVLLRRKTLCITNKDHRQDAWMDYQTGRRSRSRYLFRRWIYDPILFAQYHVVVRFCHLVFFKGSELVRDFGRGRPHVRLLYNPAHSMQHVLSEAALKAKLADYQHVFDTH